MTVCTEAEGIAALRAAARMRGERMYEIGAYYGGASGLRDWANHGFCIGPIDGFGRFVPRLCWRAVDRALVVSRTIEIAGSVSRRSDLDPA